MKFADLTSTAKIAILGYGAEGRSAYQFLVGEGFACTVFYYVNPKPGERAAIDHLPAGAVEVPKGTDYEGLLDDFDLVIRADFSPTPVKTSAPITTINEIFFELCPAPIIGVTGTKGKSTTSSLIHHILKENGIDSWLGGNIGNPVLDMLPDIGSNDWVVLELSNFQLEYMHRSPHIAVMLHIGTDHLDYHPNLQAYHNSKAALFAFQKPEDIAIYQDDDPVVAKHLAKSAAEVKLPISAEHETEGVYQKEGKIYFRTIPICSVGSIPLVGEHNISNVCAAVATTYQVLEDPEGIALAIASFKPLAHRLQQVGEHNGVCYIDDSIATNPDTTIAAIKSFTEPKVLILGGSDKGNEFDELATEIARSNVRAVVLMGALKDKIRASLDKVGFDALSEASGMTEAVQIASGKAERGDVVLLSPACASFDMFTSYADRGEQFAQAVKNLT